MRHLLLPSLTDHLHDHGINGGQLYSALQAYIDDLNLHIQTKHDQFARPLEYLAAEDFRKKIVDFHRQIPEICPDFDDVSSLDDLDLEEDD